MADEPSAHDEGLSFDDVLLVPQHTEVLPAEVDTSSVLTRDISLRIPLVSSPMDTVTTSRLAVALARAGGIGIIHRNMPPAVQAEEVDRVKRSEHGMIRNPITLSPSHTVRDALDAMARYHISGVPVTRRSKLVGIITNRDVRFEDDYSKKIDEVMTKHRLITGREGMTLDQAKAILQKHKIEKLPIVDDKGRLRGLITIKDIEKIRQFPAATKDHNGRLRVGAAVGALVGLKERLAALVEAEVDVVVVDSAHGDSRGVIAAVKHIKSAHPELPVIAGNVATSQGARALIEAGADAIRCGVGPGSICTTRIVAGIGVPQLSAIMACASEARHNAIPVIADGGVRYSGDVVKALAAGANTVMIGSLFAGTDESPGDIEVYRGRSFKVYRAMGSIGAMKEGSSDRYFQVDESALVPEGVEGRVPHRGPLAATVHQLIGGLRSGMGYCGAATLDHLREGAHFVRITSAGWRESHPHDVWITKENPNYSSFFAPERFVED
jgi:IMP dehydrogenase